MLRFLVCDMGNVLIRFDPELFFDRLEISDPGDRELLLREIFRSPLWPQLDLGELTEAELEEQVLPRLPRRLHAAAHALIFEWDRPIQPVPGMAGFLEECKKAGLGLYLLSNASVRQPEYWPRVPGSHLFDGGCCLRFLPHGKAFPGDLPVYSGKIPSPIGGVPVCRRCGGERHRSGWGGNGRLSFHRGCCCPAPEGKVLRNPSFP